MGKAGRKPKHGVQRTTSGRISRAAEAQREADPNGDRDAQKVVKLRRMKEELERNVTHPMFDFPLGKLALLGIITQDEYDAGKAWAELTWRWSQMDGLMLPKCKAIEWGGAGGRSLREPPTQEKIDATRTRKDEADNRIRKAGLGAISEMMRVCVCDEEPSNRLLLKRALQKLLDR